MPEFLFDSKPWFKITQLAPELLAVREPLHGQDVVSYAILTGDKVHLIDSGMGVADISKVFGPRKIVSAFLTHSHWDHVGGANLADKSYVGDEPFELDRVKRGWELNEMKGFQGDFTTPQPDPSKLARFSIMGTEHPIGLKDGDQVELSPELSIKTIATPGHTPGSVSYFVEQRGWLFTGDTLYPGPEYLHLPESNVPQYQESLKRLLNIIGNKAKAIHPGHNTTQADLGILEDHLHALRGLSENKGINEGEDDFGKFSEQKWDRFSLRLPR